MRRFKKRKKGNSLKKRNMEDSMIHIKTDKQSFRLCNGDNWG